MKNVGVILLLAGFFISVHTARAQGAPTIISLNGTAAGICNQEVQIDLDITDVTNLQGYDIRLSYDPTIITASMVFDNSFFNTAGAFIVPGSGCAGGTCIIGAAKIGPNTAVSSAGTETLATITLASVGENVDTLDFSYSKLSDPDGFVIEHSLSSGVGIPACPSVVSILNVTGGPNILSDKVLFILIAITMMGLSALVYGKYVRQRSC